MSCGWVVQPEDIATAHKRSFTAWLAEVVSRSEGCNFAVLIELIFHAGSTSPPGSKRHAISAPQGHPACQGGSVGKLSHRGLIRALFARLRCVLWHSTGAPCNDPVSICQQLPRIYIGAPLRHTMHIYRRSSGRSRRCI